MSLKYCQEEHAPVIEYYISSLHMAVCLNCKNNIYLKQGYDCSSIDSMGKAFRFDLKALKDKFTVINDEINARQEKIKWVFEKLRDSVNGAIDSYIDEVLRTKELLTVEIDNEKEKFTQNFINDIRNLQDYINNEEATLENFLQQIDTVSNPQYRDFTSLLNLIPTIDLNIKNNELEENKFKINPILIRDPVLPYFVNKRAYTKESIMTQIEINRPYETYPEKQVVPPTINAPVIDSQPIMIQPMVHCFSYDKLYIYDVSREKKYIIDVPPPDIFPNKNFPTALINDSIFVCGGSTQEIFALRSSFQFNMVNLEFVQKKGMLNGRCKHVLAVLNPSTIYSLGGARGKSAIRECIKYDLSTDTWVQGPYLNYENCSMAAFSFKSRFLYIIGGMNNTSTEFASEFEKLDTLNENSGWARVNFRTNGWTPRYGMNVCQLSDQYFLIFGGQNISLQNQSFIFDPEKESLIFNSRMVQGAKFEFQQLMPVLFNYNVYSIDDEKNLHIYNVNSQTWSLIKWLQWQPNTNRSPISRARGIRSYY